MKRLRKLENRGIVTLASGERGGSLLACERCGGIGLTEEPLPINEIVIPGKTTRLLSCTCVEDSVLWRRACIPARYKDVPERALFTPPSCLLSGKSGRGKSYAAIGMLKTYSRTYYGGKFCDLQQLEMDRRAAVASGKQLPGEEYIHAPFLVADDLGRGERVSAFWGEFLAQLIYTRYNFRLITIFTSNFTKEELSDKIGDHLVGRIVEMCFPHLYQLSGKDYRDLSVLRGTNG